MQKIMQFATYHCFSIGGSHSVMQFGAFAVRTAESKSKDTVLRRKEFYHS